MPSSRGEMATAMAMGDACQSIRGRGQGSGRSGCSTAAVVRMHHGIYTSVTCTLHATQLCTPMTRRYVNHGARSRTRMRCYRSEKVVRSVASASRQVVQSIDYPFAWFPEVHVRDGLCPSFRGDGCRRLSTAGAARKTDTACTFQSWRQCSFQWSTFNAYAAVPGSEAARQARRQGSRSHAVRQPSCQVVEQPPRPSQATRRS